MTRRGKTGRPGLPAGNLALLPPAFQDAAALSPSPKGQFLFPFSPSVSAPPEADLASPSLSHPRVFFAGAWASCSILDLIFPGPREDLVSWSMSDLCYPLPWVTSISHSISNLGFPVPLRVFLTPSFCLFCFSRLGD
jgi:hypothetical protein